MLQLNHVVDVGVLKSKSAVVAKVLDVSSPGSR